MVISICNELTKSSCLCHTHAHVHTHTHTHTGTAYIHGIKHATGDFIILMDADLSHHVSLCLKMADIV